MTTQAHNPGTQWFSSKIQIIDTAKQTVIVSGNHQARGAITIPFSRCTSDLICLEIGAPVTLARSPFSGEFLLVDIFPQLVKADIDCEGYRSAFIDVGGLKKLRIFNQYTEVGVYVDRYGNLNGYNPGWERSSVPFPSNWPSLEELTEPTQSTSLALVEAWVESEQSLVVQLEDRTKAAIPVPLSYFERNEWVERSWGGISADARVFPQGTEVLVVDNGSGYRVIGAFNGQTEFSLLYRDDGDVLTLEASEPSVVCGNTFHVSFSGGTINICSEPLSDRRGAQYLTGVVG